MTVGGLKVELSLWTGFTDTASDLEIAKAILHHMRFFYTYEAVSNGADFDLKLIRASKSKAKQHPPAAFKKKLVGV